MIRPALRVYSGPQLDADTAVLSARHSRPRTVTIRAGEILESLADAVNQQRAWIKDFEDEDITISADLYDVLTAYRNLRPSA